MSSDQATQLLETLKVYLKQHNITYKALAQRCDLSEVSIKRLLNRPHIGLDQLLQLCQAAGTDLATLMQLAEGDNSALTQPMATEQIDALFKTPALLSILKTIIEGKRTVQHIVEHYHINRPSAYLYVRELEKLNHIELDGDNIKVKYPMHTAIKPALHKEATRIVLERTLNSIRDYALELSDTENIKGLLYSGSLILNELDYLEYLSELDKLIERYSQKSLANIKRPDPDNKAREQFIMLMPHAITPAFPVENLVEDTLK